MLSYISKGHIMEMWMIILLAYTLHLQTASAQKEPVYIAAKADLEVVKMRCGNGRNTEISFTNLEQLYPANKEVVYTILDSTGKQHPECPVDTVTKKIAGVVAIPNKIGTCASSVTVVGTKPNRKLEVKYSIKLKGTQPDNSVYISASKKPIFEAKCSYNLDREMSTGAVAPVIGRTDEESGKIIDPNFVGLWELYEDDQYTTPTTHVPGDIKVNVGDVIYSNLKMKTELNTDYKTQLIECWASPTVTAKSDGQYIIVAKGCGKNGAQVTKTHTEKESRFSFQSFIFTQFTTDSSSVLNRVYVQCTLGICMDQPKNACPTTPTCSGRARRSVRGLEESTNSYTQLVSLGPFVVGSNEENRCDPATQVCHCKQADDLLRNCDQLCVLDEDHKPTCICELGFSLSHDGRTCLRDDSRKQQLDHPIYRSTVHDWSEPTIFHAAIAFLLIMANAILSTLTFFYFTQTRNNKTKKAATSSFAEKKERPLVLVDMPVSTSAAI